MILFILQNAYQSEKYNFRNNDEWFSDLMRSHSGRRLKEMFPATCEIKVINASPQIGKSAKSFYEADLKYIQKKRSNLQTRFYLCLWEGGSGWM